MDEKTIAAIALSNRDFPSFDAKLAEAVQWIELCAAQGADLAVLPEGMNLYAGDGPGNPNALKIQDVKLRDWRRQTAVLFDAARRCRIAVTIPVYKEEGGRLVNCMYLVSREGDVLGCYEKTRPTMGELDDGVAQAPLGQPLMKWEGLTVGAAICFDTKFQEVFREQFQRGAQLFLVPSLWPGGDALNFYAQQYTAPIVLAYPAWSRIIDLTGREIAEAGYRSETLRFGFGSPIAMATINFDRVVVPAGEANDKVVELQKRYGHRARVQFDQKNCVYYLESRCRDLNVQQLLEEFEMVSIHEYVANCRQRFGAAAEAVPV